MVLSGRRAILYEGNRGLLSRFHPRRYHDRHRVQRKHTSLVADAGTLGFTAPADLDLCHSGHRLCNQGHLPALGIGDGRRLRLILL